MYNFPPKFGFGTVVGGAVTGGRVVGGRVVTGAVVTATVVGGSVEGGSVVGGVVVGGTVGGATMPTMLKSALAPKVSWEVLENRTSLHGPEVNPVNVYEPAAVTAMVTPQLAQVFDSAAGMARRNVESPDSGSAPTVAVTVVLVFEATLTATNGLFLRSTFSR